MLWIAAIDFMSVRCPRLAYAGLRFLPAPAMDGRKRWSPAGLRSGGFMSEFGGFTSQRWILLLSFACEEQLRAWLALFTTEVGGGVKIFEWSEGNAGAGANAFARAGACVFEGSSFRWAWTSSDGFFEVTCMRNGSKQRVTGSASLRGNPAQFDSRQLFCCNFLACTSWGGVIRIKTLDFGNSRNVKCHAHGKQFWFFGLLDRLFF